MPNARRLLPLRSLDATSIQATLLGAIALCASVACSGEPDASAATAVEITRPIVLTEAARGPESDARVSGVEVYPDRLVFLLREPAPDLLAPGHVVAGAMGGAYLRKVVAVGPITKARFEVSTTPAQLTELIADGAFRARTRLTDTDVAERAAGLTASDVGVDASGLEARVQVFPPTGLPGVSCAGGYAGNLNVKPILDFDLDAEVDLDIRRGLGRPPQLEHALFTLTGQVDAGLEVESTRAFTGACSFDAIDFLRTHLAQPHLFKIRRAHVLFFVGPVPVVLVHTLEPVATIGITAQLERGGVGHKVVASTSIRVGAELERGEWRGIFEPTSKTESTFNRGIYTTGDSSLTGSLNGGLRYQALLWDAVGAKTSLERATEARLQQRSSDCAWSFLADTGLKASIGVELRIPGTNDSVADASFTHDLPRLKIASESGAIEGCAPTPENEPSHPMPNEPGPEGEGGPTTWSRFERGWQESMIDGALGEPATTELRGIRTSTYTRIRIDTFVPSRGQWSEVYEHVPSGVPNDTVGTHTTIHTDGSVTVEPWHMGGGYPGFQIQHVMHGRCMGDSPATAVWNDGERYAWSHANERRGVIEHREYAATHSAYAAYWNAHPDCACDANGALVCP